MYLEHKFGLNLSLSEITLLFDLSLYLNRTLAQRKAKSEVKVAHCQLGSVVTFTLSCKWKANVVSHAVNMSVATTEETQ